jgi:hypothetical protein
MGFVDIRSPQQYDNAVYVPGSVNLTVSKVLSSCPLEESWWSLKIRISWVFVLRRLYPRLASDFGTDGAISWTFSRGGTSTIEAGMFGTSTFEAVFANDQNIPDHDFNAILDLEELCQT